MGKFCPPYEKQKPYIQCKIPETRLWEVIYNTKRHFTRLPTSAYCLVEVQALNPKQPGQNQSISFGWSFFSLFQPDGMVNADRW